MNENKPKNMQKIKIIQTPNRLNYSKQDFKILLSDLCKNVSESNIPHLVEIAFLNTDEMEANENNTICLVQLPILPERYGYEKTLDEFFTFWENQRQAGTLALMHAKPRIPKYASYIQFKVLHTPSHIKEFLETGKHEEFERFRAGVDDFMALVRQVYPEESYDINNYIASCASGSVRLQGLTESLLSTARHNDSIYPVATDKKQADRLVDYICFELAQNCRWAFENCEDDKAKTLQSFKMYDDDFVIDMNCKGRIADAVCEITLPTIKKFNLILSRAQGQPGNNN